MGELPVSSGWILPTSAVSLAGNATPRGLRKQYSASYAKSCSVLAKDIEITAGSLIISYILLVINITSDCDPTYIFV